MPRRTQYMQDYVADMRRRGHTQVKLWVPVIMSSWMHRMADDARVLYESGTNPLARLPQVLLPRETDAPPPPRRVAAAKARRQ